MRSQPRSRFKRNAPTQPERRLAVRVLARRLSDGQKDPWMPVGDFGCDASEFRREMRDVANSLSTDRAGDVLAFRVNPKVDGVTSFYWYLSPERGPLPVPRGDREVFLSKTKMGKDWLSLWTEAEHPLPLFAALASLDKSSPSRYLWEAYYAAVAAVARHPAIVAEPTRNVAALASLSRGAPFPRPRNGARRPAHVIELLGNAMRDVATFQGGSALEWREQYARPIVSAILDVNALLGANRVDWEINWKDPAFREERAIAERSLSTWVRDLVSLDVLAVALNAPARVGTARS